MDLVGVDFFNNRDMKSPMLNAPIVVFFSSTIIGLATNLSPRSIRDFTDPIVPHLWQRHEPFEHIQNGWE